MEINLNFVVIIRTEGKKSSKYLSRTYSIRISYPISKLENASAFPIPAIHLPSPAIR